MTSRLDANLLPAHICSSVYLHSHDQNLHTIQIYTCVKNINMCKSRHVNDLIETFCSPTNVYTDWIPCHCYACQQTKPWTLFVSHLYQMFTALLRRWVLWWLIRQILPLNWLLQMKQRNSEDYDIDHLGLAMCSFRFRSASHTGRLSPFWWDNVTLRDHVQDSFPDVWWYV